MANYAVIEDIELLYRTLSDEEKSKVNELLTVSSSMLRLEAKKRGYDLDTLISEDEDYSNVVKLVVCESVIRALRSCTSSDNSTMSPLLSQYSQSALGYSVSGTFLNPGDELYFLKNELKRLGLLKQRYGVIEFYGD